eukprot:149636-Hanusia_phi.AAC.6
MWCSPDSNAHILHRDRTSLSLSTRSLDKEGSSSRSRASSPCRTSTLSRRGSYTRGYRPSVRSRSSSFAPMNLRRHSPSCSSFFVHGRNALSCWPGVHQDAMKEEETRGRRARKHAVEPYLRHERQPIMIRQSRERFGSLAPRRESSHCLCDQVFLRWHQRTCSDKQLINKIMFRALQCTIDRMLEREVVGFVSQEQLV